MATHQHDPKPHALTISVKEAAALLGIGRSLAYELVRRGELPAIALGGRLVVPKDAITQMLQDAVTKVLDNGHEKSCGGPTNVVTP